MRDLALFNMALDRKLRGCDLVKLQVSDVVCSSSVLSRATVLQQKTGSPVQFELIKGTREAVAVWIKMAHLRSTDYLFQSRLVLPNTSQPGNTTVFVMDGLESTVRYLVIEVDDALEISESIEV